MCLELVNIDSGFQESIHSMSLKQESFCLSLPLSYCCCTFFHFFLTRQGISNNIISCHMGFLCHRSKSRLLQLIIVMRCFLVGTNYNKIWVFTMKCRKIFLSILYSSRPDMWNFGMCCNIPGADCKKCSRIDLQKSHSQALIDLTEVSYWVFLITGMSLYRLYHPHIRVFFHLSIFMYYFQNFF